MEVKFRYSKSMGVSPEEARKRIIEELGTSEATFYTWVSRYKDELEEEGAIKLVREGGRDMLVEIDPEKFISFIKNRERRNISPGKRMREMRKKLYDVVSAFSYIAQKLGLKVESKVHHRSLKLYPPDLTVYKDKELIGLVDIKIVSDIKMLRLYDTAMQLLLAWDYLTKGKEIAIMVYILIEEDKGSLGVPGGVWRDKLTHLSFFINRYIPVNFLVYVAPVRSTEEKIESIEDALRMMEKGKKGVFVYKEEPLV